MHMYVYIYNSRCNMQPCTSTCIRMIFRTCPACVEINMKGIARLDAALDYIIRLYTI